MSDYFTRLAGRAAGGAAARPLLRALPALYAPQEQLETLVAIDEEQLAPQSPRAAAVEPPMRSHAGDAPQPAPRPRAETITIREATETPPPQAPTRDAQRSPLLADPARPRERVQADPVPASPASADTVTTAPHVTETETIRQIERIVPGRKAATNIDPPPAKPAKADVSRPLVRAEPQPAVGSPPAPPVQAVTAAAADPPTVTIGRIDISVAPPPPAPRAAPDSRTRGFQSYARLRRGLVR